MLGLGTRPEATGRLATSKAEDMLQQQVPLCLFGPICCHCLSASPTFAAYMLSVSAGKVFPCRISSSASGRLS